MPHTCKTDFWGETAETLLLWLNYLDSILPQHSVTHLTPATWQSMCALQSAIEIATGIPATFGPLCQDDAQIDAQDEAQIREVVQLLTALLIADHHDNTKSNPHSPLAPGWMWTPQTENNPEAGAMEKLAGKRAPQTVDPVSVLGRIRNSLGS